MYADTHPLPMALAQSVVIAAIIRTHPDPAALEAEVAQIFGKAEHLIDREQLDDTSLQEAIAEQLRFFLGVIRQEGARRSPP
jgi:hypothetical protein